MVGKKMLKRIAIFQSPIAHRMFRLFLISSIFPLLVLIFLFWLSILEDPLNYPITTLKILKSSLIIFTLAYILFLLLLSIKQIRNILLPLQKLRMGTREVANQKFS